MKTTAPITMGEVKSMNCSCGKPARLSVLCRLLVIFAVIGAPMAMSIASATPAMAKTAEEEVQDGYYSLVTDTGEVVFVTSLKVTVGDQFITEDNKQYTVTSLQGKIAHVKFDGKLDLSGYLPPEKGILAATWEKFLAALWPRKTGTAGNKQTIAIYHTHSDESYVPTSGVSSKPWGDIYKVGKVLQETLKKEGYNAVQSRANHNPHDGAAYERSRRTVTKLLRDYRPVTLFDVHRDAVPAKFYTDTIANTPIVKITLVVGRENQNRTTILEYAKTIKAQTDRKVPRLIKGIFNAAGDYNQDVAPRMMLLEFGSHLTSLERADNAAKFFARIMPGVLASAGIKPPAGQQVTVRSARNAGSLRARETSAASRTAIILVGIVVVLGALFLILNAGSWEGLRKQLGRFFGREFTNTVGVKQLDPEKDQPKPQDTNEDGQQDNGGSDQSG